jgi:hypothetical protein
MKRYHKKLFLFPLVFFTLLSLFSLSPLFTHAADYTLTAPLPGMPKTVPANFNPANYIQYFFSFGLYLMSFLAVGIIALGGIMWMLAAGNPGKIDKAKEMIVGALSGLVLLLCSWLILNTIDSGLTNISAPTLEKYDIEAIPAHEGLGYGLTDQQITSSAIAQGAYANFINKYAQQNGGLPPTLVKAVILTESSGNPNAVSPEGATGLMQTMPGTFNQYKDPSLPNDPTNPESSVAAGTKYLGYLYNKYNKDLDKTLAAYNWGEGNLQRKCGGNPTGCSQLPPETQNYINKVKRTQSDLIV